VERVNSRIDHVLGFENHTIRELQKMLTRMGLALVVMLSMAVGHLQAGRREQMRSFVGAIPDDGREERKAA
jgi:predicted amino acid racemase